MVGEQAKRKLEDAQNELPRLQAILRSAAEAEAAGREKIQRRLKDYQAELAKAEKSPEPPATSRQLRNAGKKTKKKTKKKTSNQ